MSLPYVSDVRETQNTQKRSIFSFFDDEDGPFMKKNTLLYSSRRRLKNEEKIDIENFRGFFSSSNSPTSVKFHDLTLPHIKESIELVDNKMNGR